MGGSGGVGSLVPNQNSRDLIMLMALISLRILPTVGLGSGDVMQWDMYHLGDVVKGYHMKTTKLRSYFKGINMTSVANGSLVSTC